MGGLPALTRKAGTVSQPEKEAGGEAVSRRRVLRLIGFAAIGAAAVFAAGSVLGKASSAPGGGDPASSNQTSPVAHGADPTRSTITVQVEYFQMSTIDATGESFVLQSPANYNDLLSQVMARHPLLTAMMPSMVVFIDGNPAQSGTALKDGDEIDFIPIFAGG